MTAGALYRQGESVGARYGGQLAILRGLGPGHDLGGFGRDGDADFRPPAAAFRAAAHGDEIGDGRVVAVPGADRLQVRPGVVPAVVVEAVDPERHGTPAMLAEGADMGRLGGLGRRLLLVGAMAGEHSQSRGRMTKELWVAAPWTPARRQSVPSGNGRSSPRMGLRRPEILIQQERQSNAGQQQLTPHDGERSIPIAQNVGVLEVGAFLEIVERHREGKGVGFIAPGQPGRVVGGSDLRSALVGRDAPEDVISQLPRAPATGELLDKAVIPYRVQFDPDTLHLARRKGPGTAGLVAAIDDSEVIAAAVSTVHVERLVEISHQVLNPGDGDGLRLPATPSVHDRQLGLERLEQAFPADEGRPVVGQVRVVPRAELVARVVIANRFVWVAGSVDEIAIHLELGEQRVHRLDLGRRQQLHGDRRHGPVSEAAPREGGGRGGTDQQKRGEEAQSHRTSPEEIRILQVP